MIKGILKQLEVGILLTDKSNKEYDFYSKVYGGKYGFYNENNIAYREADVKEAIEYAKEYVKNGVDMTYAILTNQGLCEYDEPFDDGATENFTYEYSDIEYSIAKINGTIVEGFIGTDNAAYGKYVE